MATHVPISKKLVLANSASSVLARLLNVALLVWVIQHLVKRIADSEYQLLVVVSGLMLFLPPLTTFLTAGLARFVTEAYAQGDTNRVTEITSTMFPITALATVVVSLLGGMGVYWVDYILDIPPELVTDARWMLGLLLALAMVRLLVAPFGVGMFVRQKFVVKNATQLAGALLRVVLLPLLLFGIGPEVKWVVVASVTSDLLVLVVQTAISMRLVPALRFRRSAIRPQLTTGLFSFGTWYVLGQIAVTIRQAADPILLNRLALPVDVTNFHLAATADIQIRQMRMTAVVPLLPALTAMHAKGNRAALGSAYLRGGRLSLWVLLAVAVPLMVFRVELLQAYLGTAFAEHGEAATALLLLLAAFPLIAARGMLQNVLYAIDRLRVFTTWQVVAQGANLALTVVLLTVWGLGAVGAALATLVTTLVFDPLVYWPLALRELQLSWSRFVREVLLPGWTPGLVAALAGEALRRSVRPEQLLVLSACVAACVLVFVLVAALCLQKQDRRDLGAVVRKFKQVVAW